MHIYSSKEAVMKQRLIVALIAAVMILGGIIGKPPKVSAGEPQTKAAEHRFRVGKLNNMWKVYDSKDFKNRVITAKRGEKVIWSAMGSDVFLHFPDSTIFGATEASATDGKELALVVSANAKPGKYTYSIFCAKEKTYATGDSPPVIIIQ